MRFIPLIGALALLLAGQDTTNPTQNHDPSIWIYNAAYIGPSVRLDYLLDGVPIASSVYANAISGRFTPIKREKASFAVRRTNEYENLLETQIDSVTSDHVIVLLGDADRALDYADLSVIKVRQADGLPRINVLSAISKDDAGGDLDVYVVKPDSSIESVSPMAEALAYKASVSLPVAPGTYVVIVTMTGTKDILATSDPINAKVLDRLAALLIPKVDNKPDKIVLLDLRQPPADPGKS